MYRATWNGAVLAESAETVEVEGNQYFPAESINRQYFTPSEAQSSCPWKGLASYYSVVVEGKTNQDAAWYYAEPKEKAANIKGRVAFWRGVLIEKV